MLEQLDASRTGPRLHHPNYCSLTTTLLSQHKIDGLARRSLKLPVMAMEGTVTLPLARNEIAIDTNGQIGIHDESIVGFA